jgi:multiple sugar transport system permease protein
MLVSAKIKSTIESILIYIGVIVVVLFAFFPVYWMIAISFKVEGDILTIPPKFLFQPTLTNYQFVFEKSDFILGIKNSLILIFAVSIIVVPISALAAYSFARFNTGGGNLQFYILTTRMFPPIAAVLPFFLLFNFLGLLDNIVSLILLNSVFNLPFTVWLLYGFFRDIPPDLEEAAMTEGATRFEAFREIVLPLVAPGLAVSAIFTIIFTWNEYLFAYILTRSQAITITRVVAGFFTERGILWGPLCAAATLCTIPMLIMALIIQRYIVRGLTFGAVK